MTTTQPNESPAIVGHHPPSEFNTEADIDLFESTVSDRILSFLDHLEHALILHQSMDERMLTIPIATKMVQDEIPAMTCNVLALQTLREDQIFEQVVRAGRLLEMLDEGRLVEDETSNLYWFEGVSYPLLEQSVEDYFTRPFRLESVEAGIEFLLHDGDIQSREEGWKRHQREKQRIITRLLFDCDVIH